MTEQKSLRSQQLESVLAMLNLNQEKSESSLAETVWKVLIYDQFGQEVISPLLRISDLRENGITVHMLLHSDRQQIADVPAIYFVEPTLKNIERICQDIEKDLYETYYINFSSSVSRDLLETLAQSTLASGNYGKVVQIFDQYLNYLSLERNLFSINVENTFARLNMPSATDQDIEALTRQIVERLYSVFITSGILKDTSAQLNRQGQVPVIRSSRGNAAESVATSLDLRLRDFVRNSRNDGSSRSAATLSSSRPVLILLDRSIDLQTMLHHTWSYQCLVHDVFEMKSNRISYMVTEGGRTAKKTYDLDINDYFWAKNFCSPFPQMAADVDSELNKYKKEVEEITKSCGVSSLEEVSQSDPSSMGGMNLKAAVSALPKLTERKRTIDMHMNIASSLLKTIKQRSLDTFIVVEEGLAKQTKSSVMDILRSPDKGSPEDKLRLFALYFLSSEQELTKADIVEFETVLKEAGCDLSPLKYLKQMRTFSKMNAISQNPGSNATKGAADFLGRFSSRIADNLNTAGFGGAIDNLMSGVRNILPTNQNLPIVKIMNDICESTGVDEDYLYLDPKAQVAPGRQQKLRQNYGEVYVFMVGGGNYVEYQNLMATGRNVTYGSTEILNSTAFLRQLASLGGDGSS